MRSNAKPGGVGHGHASDICASLFRVHDRGALEPEKTLPMVDKNIRTEFLDRVNALPPDILRPLALRSVLRILPLIHTGAIKACGFSAFDIAIPIFRSIAIAYATLLRKEINRHLKIAIILSDAACSEWSQKLYSESDFQHNVDHIHFAASLNMAHIAVASAVSALRLAESNSANIEPLETLNFAFCGYEELLKASIDDIDIMDAEKLDISTILSRPLWALHQNKYLLERWNDLENMLLEEDPSWSVWTRWYRDRLSGSPPDEELAFAIALAPYEMWYREPSAINREILRISSNNEQIIYTNQRIPSVTRVSKQKYDPLPRGGLLFISYRRADTQHAAGRIFDHLTSNGIPSTDIFFDTDTMPIAADFNRTIFQAISKSAVALALIGPNWFNPSWRVPVALRKVFRPRRDIVLEEIKGCLELDVPIVPVLIDDAKMPAFEDLPEAISYISCLNAARIRSGKDFHSDMELLTPIVKSWILIARALSKNR